MGKKLTCCAAGVLALLAFSARASAGEGGEFPREVQLAKFGTHYWIDVPKAYFEAERKDDRWPLFLGLHGAGDTAKNFVTNFGRLRDEGYLIAAIKSPGNAWSGSEDKLVLAVLEEVKRDYRIDERRVSLIGFSSGSFFGMPLVFRLPQVFNALVAMGGGGSVGVKPQAKHLHVYLVIGDQDPGRAAVEAAHEQLKKKGLDSTLRVVPGLGHTWPPEEEFVTLRKWLHAFSPEGLKEAELLEKVGEARKFLKKNNVPSALKLLIEVGESGPDCPAVLEARKELEALSTAAREELEKAQGLIEEGKKEAARSLLRQTARRYAGLPEAEEAGALAEGLE